MNDFLRVFRRRGLRNELKILRALTLIVDVFWSSVGFVSIKYGLQIDLSKQDSKGSYRVSVFLSLFVVIEETKKKNLRDTCLWTNKTPSLRKGTAAIMPRDLSYRSQSVQLRRIYWISRLHEHSFPLEVSCEGRTVETPRRNVAEDDLSTSYPRRNMSRT